jgi:hypothetical protein
LARCTGDPAAAGETLRARLPVPFIYDEQGHDRRAVPEGASKDFVAMYEKALPASKRKK